MQALERQKIRPGNLSFPRGSDTSNVQNQCFVSVRIGVRPAELELLDRTALKQGVSRAELMRQLIRKLAVPA